MPHLQTTRYLAAFLLIGSYWPGLVASAQERPTPSEVGSKDLLTAILQGDSQAVDQLLRDGASPNVAFAESMSPVQVAMVRGYPTIAKQLLDAGAEPAPTPDPLDFAKKYIDDIINADAPGLSILVARDGKVLLNRSFGLADKEASQPIQSSTKFRIGSVTKQFTASAILKLVQAGEIRIEDTLDKFLPDFPGGAKVTIHHLLTHTSGIPSYTDDPNFFKTVTEPTTEEELIATIAGKEFSFEPGSAFHYNNSGYFLLGHIVRKVSGDSLADFCQKEFFDPLKMYDTGFHVADADLADEAKGYSFEDGATEPALDWDMSRAGGAGAIYSTVDDLFTWNEAVFSGRVLPDDLLKKAFTPVDVSIGKMNYGYGWMMGKSRGLRMVSHGGGLQGFLSDLLRFPDQNLTVAVLHNCSAPMPGMNPGSVSRRLAEIFLWKEMEPRTINAMDDSVDASDFDRYLGRYDYGTAIMEITRDGDQLLTQITGQPKFKLFPKGGTTFFLKVVEAEVEFVVEDGKCVAVKHRQGPVKFTAKKIEAIKKQEMTPEELDQFVGRYDYGMAEMTIRRDGKRLLAKLGGQPELEVIPQSDSVLAWKDVPAKLEFKRDAEGKIKSAKHFQGGQSIDVKVLSR